MSRNQDHNPQWGTLDSIGPAHTSSLIFPEPRLETSHLSRWPGLSPMPHALCFSLLLWLKPTYTQKPSWQRTCSRKTLLTPQPSHISSLPFPKNTKSQYYTYFYLIKIFLLPESASDLESEKLILNPLPLYKVTSSLSKPVSSSIRWGHRCPHGWFVVRLWNGDLNPLTQCTTQSKCSVILVVGSLSLPPTVLPFPLWPEGVSALLTWIMDELFPPKELRFSHFDGSAARKSPCAHPLPQPGTVILLEKEMRPIMEKWPIWSHTY